MIVANGRRRWEGGAGHAAFPDFFRALISLESGKLALRAQTVPPSRQLTRKKSESLADVPPHLPTSSCFVPPEQFKLIFLGFPDENGFTADAVNPVLVQPLVPSVSLPFKKFSTTNNSVNLWKH